METTIPLDTLLQHYLPDPEAALYYMMDYFEEDCSDAAILFGVSRLEQLAGFAACRPGDINSALRKARQIPKEELKLSDMAKFLRAAGLLVPAPNLAPKPTGKFN